MSRNSLGIFGKYIKIPLSRFADSICSKIHAPTNQTAEKNISESPTIYSLFENYKISGGHNDSYFIIIDNKGNARIGTDGLPVPNRTLQLNEFVAHLNEIYWLDNDVWKFFDEEFYKEARKVMNKAFK